MSKGTGNFNEPSGPSMFSVLQSNNTRKKTYVIMIADDYATRAWWRYERMTKRGLRKKID